MEVRICEFELYSIIGARERYKQGCPSSKENQSILNRREYK